MKNDYFAEAKKTAAAYRRFYSHGFLRLSKLQPADGGDRYLQIGSFAGPDAVAEADELERRDRAGEHRHPYDRTEKAEMRGNSRVGRDA